MSSKTEPPLPPAASYVTFGGDDYYDDAYEEDELQGWALMLIVIAGAILLVAGIFYCSYKHEMFFFKKKFPQDGPADIEQGKKLATKSFQDSKAFERLPEQVVKEHLAEEEGEGVPPSIRTTSTGSGSTKTAEKTTVMHSLVAAPRCVLCSKPFETGENVTHSSACHHEFRESCLLNHWGKMEKSKKTKHLSGKCPVCKVEYVVEEVSPSTHFSSQMETNEEPSTKRASDVIQPFEIVEEELLQEDNNDDNNSCCGGSKQ